LAVSLFAPLSTPFVDIPFLQFSSAIRLSFILFAAIPSGQFTPYLSCRFFAPFAGIPSGQFTPYLSCRFFAPFAGIPLGQLEITSS
jgi:hypothetical protein